MSLPTRSKLLEKCRNIRKVGRPSSISLHSKKRLCAAAREAATHAYCPASDFRVGAAVLSGRMIIRGCNIENASLGLTLCAERVAIFNAVSTGRTKIDAIAISCPDTPDGCLTNLKMPCGACRQVLAEFGKPNLPIIIEGVGEFSLASLLPIAFQFQRIRPRKGSQKR